jgi:hypothetical protein
MPLIAGAVTFNSRPSQDLARAVAVRTKRYAHLKERVLLSSDRATFFVVERSNETAPVRTWVSEDGSKHWLVRDEISQVDDGTAATTPDLTLDSLLARSPPGRWLALRVSPEGDVCIATDRLGLAWLYLARGENALTFSSDFGAVASTLNKALTVDKKNAALELTLGYIPHDATLYEQIAIAPPGTVLALEAAGTRTVSRRPIVYGDRYFGLSEAEKFKRLDEIYEEIITRRVAPFRSGLILSLSAGYDSRYALAFAGKAHLDPPLFTFGEEGSDEVSGARAVATTVNRSTRLFTFVEGDWHQWRRALQQLGNCGMIQWSGWADSWLSFLQPHGNALLIGYLGDALSGRHLGRTPPADGDWLGFWRRWSTRDGVAESPLFLPNVRSSLAGHLGDALREASASAHVAAPHQTALHLDLYCRQRRWVAGQPNLISRFLSPSLFFYDEALIDFWTNLPADDLFNQRLYLAYADSRFPRLFKRHSSRRPGIAARVLKKLSRLAHAGQPNIRSNPPVIRYEPIIGPNVQRIAELIDRVAPIVGELIDVEAFRSQVLRYGNGPTMPSWQIIRIVNVMFLLELGLGDPHAGAPQVG